MKRSVLLALLGLADADAIEGGRGTAPVAQSANQTSNLIIKNLESTAKPVQAQAEDHHEKTEAELD